jgi:hypothetical protein
MGDTTNSFFFSPSRMSSFTIGGDRCSSCRQRRTRLSDPENGAPVRRWSR